MLFVTANTAWADDESSPAEELRILNEGYSLLYSGVSGASNANQVFLVKFENDATEKVIDETSEYLARLAQTAGAIGQGLTPACALI